MKYERKDEKRKAYYASICYVRHLLPRIHALVENPDQEVRKYLAETVIHDVLDMQELIKKDYEDEGV